MSVALPGALLAGCGDDAATTADDPAEDSTTSVPTQEPSPSESTPAPAAPAQPACDDVWVDGRTFPERYRGCLDGDRVVQAESTYCEFGTRLFYFGNRYYAVPNGPVNLTEKGLARDPGFQKALRKCGG